MKEENPPGNWIKYFPCNQRKGYIHPRHAFWWGVPFIRAYEETKDSNYLDIAIRCGEWYKKAVRVDGGLFRNTYLDYNTDSFGHATSGTACAAILDVNSYQAILGDPLARDRFPTGNSNYRPNILTVIQSLIDAARNSVTNLSMEMYDEQISQTELRRFFFGENGTVASQGEGGLLHHFFPCKRLVHTST